MKEVTIAQSHDRDVEGLLREILADPSSTSKAAWLARMERANSLRSSAMAIGNDADANRAWYLRTLAVARLDFIVCFDRMKNADYYKSWCNLEQIEISLNWLRDNPFVDESELGVASLAKLVAEWQKLFPYQIFLSPEFIIKADKCSICDGSSDPWSDCEHQKGRVYGGLECIRTITECEFLAISLVRDPVQKYSVTFLSDGDGKEKDHYNYSIVKFVVDRINSPFDGFEARWTTAFHPHTMFSGLLENDPCPCSSGRRYDDCCKKLSGVRRPHVQIEFEKMPPPDLANAEFSGYGDKDGPAELLPPRAEPTTE